jgi:predicted nicotinamide N-methyase
VQNFLALFSPQPGYKILDVTTHADALSIALMLKLIAVEGRLALARYPGIHTTVPECDGVTIETQTLPDYTQILKAQPRDNDVVFLRDVLQHHTQPERLLKAVYRTLTNAADVVIVTENIDADVAWQLELLEKTEFRAGNVIEGMAEGVTVVTARKMHMWGNGL